jgi:hypothetical protein
MNRQHMAFANSILLEKRKLRAWPKMLGGDLRSQESQPNLTWFARNKMGRPIGQYSRRERLVAYGDDESEDLWRRRLGQASIRLCEDDLRNNLKLHWQCG